MKGKRWMIAVFVVAVCVAALYEEQLGSLFDEAWDKLTAVFSSQQGTEPSQSAPKTVKEKEPEWIHYTGFFALPEPELKKFSDEYYFLKPVECRLYVNKDYSEALVTTYSYRIRTESDWDSVAQTFFLIKGGSPLVSYEIRGPGGRLLPQTVGLSDPEFGKLEKYCLGNLSNLDRAVREKLQDLFVGHLGAGKSP
jgi:hypothetical protein